MKTKEEIAEGIEQYVNYRLEQERERKEYYRELYNLLVEYIIAESITMPRHIKQKLKEAREGNDFS